MGIDVCSASLLKDIRIGEHNGFTRIVFVLDQQASESHIESLSEKSVRITINASKPDLVRKIQVGQSPNIKDIRILTGKEQLSTILDLGPAHTKVSSFPMKKPPRLVFDIFWQTPGDSATEPVLKRGTTAETPSTELSTIETGPIPEVTTKPAMETAAVDPAMDTNTSTPPPASGDARSKALSPKTKHAAAYKKESANDTAQASTGMAAVEKAVPSDLPVEESPEPQQAAGWLQYYLVIVLVIMTIAILFLLAVMLLSKYRLANDTSHLSASEHIKRQDKHIDSIDERIKEQLKRYDEA